MEHYLPPIFEDRVAGTDELNVTEDIERNALSNRLSRRSSALLDYSSMPHSGRGKKDSTTHIYSQFTSHHSERTKFAMFPDDVSKFILKVSFIHKKYS